MRAIALVLALYSGVSFGVTGTATFKAKGTLPGMSIDGTGISISGDLGKILEADLTKIKTGKDLRDKHTQEHLETAKWPKATLEVRTYAYDKLSGDLTLHGVTRAINVDLKKEGNKHKGSFPLTLSDFGIKKPSYLGVGVEDTIEVFVEVTE